MVSHLWVKLVQLYWRSGWYFDNLQKKYKKDAMIIAARHMPYLSHPSFIGDGGISVNYYLTQWGRDKVAAILQTTFSNVFSSMNMFKGPMNNIPALVQIMARQAIIWNNDDYFADAYIRHSAASMS